MKTETDRWGKYVLPVIAMAALAITFGTTFNLGTERLHWPAWQAILLPVTLDVLAGYGVSQWLTGGNVTVRNWGRAVALTCMGISVLVNATEHAAAALDGSTSRRWMVLGLALGAIPPVSFSVAVHLYALTHRSALLVKPAAPKPSTPSTEPKTRKAPEPKPAKLHAVNDLDSLVATATELNAKHVAEHGRPINRDTLRVALGGIRNEVAGQVLAQVKGKAS